MIYFFAFNKNWFHVLIQPFHSKSKTISAKQFFLELFYLFFLQRSKMFPPSSAMRNFFQRWQLTDIKENYLRFEKSGALQITILFQHIWAYCSLFQPISAYSNLLQYILANSSLFQPIPVFASLFQHIPAYSSRFQPVSSVSPVSSVFSLGKWGITWASLKARVTSKLLLAWQEQTNRKQPKYSAMAWLESIGKSGIGNSLGESIFLLVLLFSGD